MIQNEIGFRAGTWNCVSARDQLLFLDDDERLLDEDDVPRLPELPEDLDTPDEERPDDPERFTAVDPPDRPEDDLPTAEERDDRLPAAD